MVDLDISCTMTAVHPEVTTSEGALDIMGLHRSLYYSSLPSLYLSGVPRNKLQSTARQLVIWNCLGIWNRGKPEKKNAGIYLKTRKFRSAQWGFFQWLQAELGTAEFACKSRQRFWDRTAVCKTEQFLKILLLHSTRTSGFKAKKSQFTALLVTRLLGFGI